MILIQDKAGKAIYQIPEGKGVTIKATGSNLEIRHDSQLTGIISTPSGEHAVDYLDEICATIEAAPHAKQLSIQINPTLFEKRN